VPSLAFSIMYLTQHSKFSSSLSSLLATRLTKCRLKGEKEEPSSQHAGTPYMCIARKKQLFVLLLKQNDARYTRPTN
jgi:hypothetical protein